MPTPRSVDYAPPSNWQDLERLAADLFTEIYGRPFSRWGRNGQPQNGIDLSAVLANGKAVVVQCKSKDQKLGKELKPDDVNEALNATRR